MPRRDAVLEGDPCAFPAARLFSPGKDSSFSELAVEQQRQVLFRSDVTPDGKVRGRRGTPV